MRNTNRSFIENAICRFANEAGQVLRAFTDPAISLVRLFSTAVSSLCGYLVPESRLYQPHAVETSANVTLRPEHNDFSRMPGKVFGTLGQRGVDVWSGLLGQTVS